LEEVDIMQPNYTYKSKLVRVIDGDTIVVMLDLGHDILVKRHIRLLDVNAPETGTKELAGINLYTEKD